MTSLHPHWHATDGDEVPVRVRAATQAPSDPAKTPVIVSRKPAAVVGILGVIALGFFLLHGSLDLPGQIASDIEVRITEMGLDPAFISARPGQTITWHNEDIIPHILSSETLPTEETPYLETPAVFPGSSVSVTIAADAAPGMHTYTSKTSTAINGQIEILGTSAPALASAPSSAPMSSAPAFFASSLSSAAAPVVPPSSFEEPPVTPPAPPSNSLPTNPYTVGTSGQQGAVTPPITEHTPVSTTDTGPAVWFIVAASIVLLHVSTRRLFRTPVTMGTGSR